MQVFDDVAIELTMALLQFFSVKPIEEHLFRTLKALSKFLVVNNNDNCLFYRRWPTSISIISIRFRYLRTYPS